MLLDRRLWDFDRTFDEMARMFDMFERPLGLRSVPRGTFPAVNVYDENEKYLVSAELPGVKVEDIDLQVVENTLTLQGKREGMPENGSRFYRHERPAGTFKRTIALNEKVDPEGVKAEYRNGLLKISLPKVKKAEPKSITIKTK